VGHQVGSLADTAYDEDANTGYAGNGPQLMATLRSVAMSRDRNRVLDYLSL
jgi:hypothetical protein